MPRRLINGRIPRKGAPAILENPRYTGYAIFGRWTKHETLLDPDDVTAGHIVRFRRSSPDRVVRSRRPAHPEIVSVDTFTQAQLMRRSRAAGGMRGRGKLDRRTFTTSRPYRLRGRFRCTVCERKMLAATIRDTICYRCLARTIAPGSLVLADHPRTVNVREDHVIDPLNDWIMQVYDREHIDQTVAAIVAANPRLTAARSRRTRAEVKLNDAEAPSPSPGSNRSRREPDGARRTDQRGRGGTSGGESGADQPARAEPSDGRGDPRAHRHDQRTRRYGVTGSW